MPTPPALTTAGVVVDVTAACTTSGPTQRRHRKKSRANTSWLTVASVVLALPSSLSSWFRCMLGLDTSMSSRHATSSVPHCREDSGE